MASANTNGTSIYRDGYILACIRACVALVSDLVIGEMGMEDDCMTAESRERPGERGQVVGLTIPLIEPPPSFRSNVKRGKGGKTYNNPRYTQFRQIIQAKVSEYAREKYPDFEMWDGPVGLSIEFGYPLPLSTPKKVITELGLHGCIRKTTTPDIDNIGKGVLDALQGVLFEKDSQVSDCTYYKRYVDTCGPYINVLAWECPELEVWNDTTED